MTLMIDLPPEVESRLLHEAAKHGLRGEEYARVLIERQLPAPADGGARLWESLSPEEWVKAFEAWVDSHDYITAPAIPLDALRRENLYEDRV